MGRSRVQVNKAHKTRFSSKSSRNLHKTSLQGKKLIINFISFDLPITEKASSIESDGGRIGKPEGNHVKGARAARLQRGKMVNDSSFFINLLLLQHT